MPTREGFLFPSEMEEVNKLDVSQVNAALSREPTKGGNALGFLINPQTRADQLGALGAASRLLSPPSGGENLLQSLVGAAKTGLGDKTTAELQEQLRNLNESKQRLEIAKAQQAAREESAKIQTGRGNLEVNQQNAITQRKRLGAANLSAQASASQALVAAQKEARLSGAQELVNVTVQTPQGPLDTVAKVDSQGDVVAIGDPNNPGDFIDPLNVTVTDIRKSTTPKPAKTTEDILLGIDAKRLEEGSAEAASQIPVLQNISNARRIISGMRTGFGAATVGEAKRFSQALSGIFGFDAGFTKDIASVDAIAAQTMKFVLAHIQQTKGAISEREMAAFEDASPGLAKSNLGNDILLNIGEATSRSVQERALAQRSWFERHDSLKGFDTAWEKYIKLFERTRSDAGNFAVAESNFGNFNDTYLQGGEPAWSGTTPEGNKITVTPKQLQETAENRGIPVGDLIQILQLERL